MHLTVDQKQEIRALYATGGYTQVQLAERFGVQQETISKTVRCPMRVCVDCGVPVVCRQRCATCRVVRARTWHLNYQHRNRDKLNQKMRERWAEDERYRDQHRRAAREYARRNYVRKRG